MVEAVKRAVEGGGLRSEAVLWARRGDLVWREDAGLGKSSQSADRGKKDEECVGRRGLGGEKGRGGKRWCVELMLSKDSSDLLRAG